MKTLLLSEDKAEWENIKKNLRAIDSKIDLLCAQNKEEAINFASFDGPFGFFIVDTELKKENPDEVTKSLLDICGNRPIIFIGNTNSLKAQITEDLFNANEFNETINKPLDFENFSQSISNVLAWAKREEFEESVIEVDPTDYLPIKTKNLFLYTEFPYDLMMELTTTKYIKALSANKRITHSFLSTFVKKKVQYLYIKKTDQLKFLESESERFLNNLEKITPTTKDNIVFLIKAINIFHLYINSIGVTDKMLKMGDALTNTIYKIATFHLDFDQIIRRFPSSYSGISRKSILSAILSNLISNAIGMNSALTIKKLIMASLLQDLTLKEDSLTHITSLINPKNLGYTDEEIQEFRSHPLEAAKICAQFSSYADIDYIVELHHELPNKKGFPKTPQPTKLTRICSIFNIAQNLASILDSIKTIDNLSIQKALKVMDEDYNFGNFKETFKATQKTVILKN